MMQHEYYLAFYLLYFLMFNGSMLQAKNLISSLIIRYNDHLS